MKELDDGAKIGVNLAKRLSPIGAILTVCDALNLVDKFLFDNAFDGFFDIRKNIQNIIDKFTNSSSNLPEIINGFVRITMPNGQVYMRPLQNPLLKALYGEAQGLVSGGHKYGEGDVLFGGNGNDILNGYNGSDILIGGSGNDTYFADSGDIIIDSDGKGRVFVNQILLKGGTQSSHDEKLYYDKKFNSYKLLDNGLLEINGSIIIKNYSKTKNSLGIT